MALTSNQENIVLKNLSRIGAIEDSFVSNLAATNKKLERNIMALIRANESVAAVDVGLAKAQIDKLLIDSGYFKATQDFLNSGYQQIINESFKTYKGLYGEAFRFSNASLERINAIKQLDFNQFEQLGSTAANELNRVMVEMQFGNISQSQAIKTISEDIIDKLGQHTETWLTTGSAAIARESSTMLAEDNGISEFIYVGPRDSKTRPFCQQHLNQTKTRDEWNQLSNGQIDPVFTFAGGFNCRHQLIGVK